MSNLNQIFNRYSDEELQEFKELVEAKLNKTTDELNFIQQQIQEITETMTNEGDWMDDTSNNNDLEMLYTIASRHQRHIRDLQNALLRIGNKSYGICVISGEKIDKRRLKAVPTTTKSVQAKNAAVQNTEKPSEKPTPPVKQAQKIITKVIKKNNAPTSTNFFPDVEEEKEDETFMDFGESELINKEMKDSGEFPDL